MPKASKWGSGDDLGNNGTAATEGSFPLIGQRIEHYEILELIGKGGFGEVYRAHDLLLDRDVAIKFLSTEYSRDPVHRERLIREARAASRLNHRNICTIHQMSVIEGRTFIVMELVQGETLRQIARQQPLPGRTVLRIAAQLASGLSAAHRAGIVHRDIKSSNIIFNREGESKILDFGIAKFFGSLTRSGTSSPADALTEEGSILGSVAYMSPEQLRAEPIDQRSDLFSLGVVLYELATGTLPFRGETQFDIAHAILDSRPPPPVLADSDIGELPEVVMKLLSKRPEDRYQSGEEVLAALRAGAGDGNPSTLDESALDRSTLQFSPVKRIATANLPHLANTLVGRDAEMFELGLWIEDPQTRLITLVGPGGVGKSSLALAVAHQEEAGFAQGACFVPLAHTSPSLVVAAIAQGVGYSFHGSAEPMAQLIDHLSDSETLVVLDNFEHLVNAAELVARFLQTCPRCTWLVTSRERLNLRGERVLEVSGLTYPESDPVDLSVRYSAVELFAERARQCDPSFRVEDQLSQIHEICRLTYGLPLGIELAAGWIRLISCSEIVREIRENLGFLASTSRDVPDRHRTLGTVFEYSWKLLDEREKGVFRGLSIFHGGFDRDAARVVCGASLNDLLPLLDKSLLRKETSGRLAVHELLRAFAEKKLRETREDHNRARDKHCDYYADYLRRQRDNLRGGALKRALEAVRAELKNIRHGIEWALESGRFSALEQCLEDAMLFFEITARFQEGYDLFFKIAKGLQAEAKTAQPKLAAQALAARALFSVYLGRYEEAIRTGGEALSLLDASPDETIATGYSHYSIGQAKQAMGNFDAALEHMKASLEAFRASGGTYWMNHGVIALAQLHSWRGEEEQARQHYLKGVRGCEMIGDVWGMKAGLAMLGSLDLQRGDLESAKSMFKESLDFVRDLEDRRGIANCLAQLGRVAFESGNHEEARRLYRESVALAVELRDKHRHLNYLIGLSKVEERAGDSERSQNVLLEALRLSRQSSAVPEMLAILLQVARRRHLDGNREGAIRLLALVLNHPGTRRPELAEAREWLSQLEKEADDPKWVAGLASQSSGEELDSAVVGILGESGASDNGGGPGAAGG